MADLDLGWGGDLDLDDSGDLLTISGVEEGYQRIQRRLFTPVRGYVFHSEYGAGLPQRIGRPATPGNINSLVTAHIGLESFVAKTPIPQISVDKEETVQGLFNIIINYQDSATGEPFAVSLEIPRS